MIADCSHRMMLTRALAVFVVVLMLSVPLVSIVPSGSDATDGGSVIIHGAMGRFIVPNMWGRACRPP